MTEHAKKCMPLIQTGYTPAAASSPAQMQSPAAAPAATGTAAKAEPPQSEPATKRQCQLPVISTTAHQQAVIAEQICRFVVAANIPFRAVENKQFQILVGKAFFFFCFLWLQFPRNLLRPGTQIPHQKKLAGPLLDAIYSEVCSLGEGGVAPFSRNVQELYQSSLVEK